MHASVALSVLALAASTMAAPAKVVYETKVVTVEYTAAPEPTPQAAAPPAPAMAMAQAEDFKPHWPPHGPRPKPSAPPVVVTTAPAPAPSAPAPAPEAPSVVAPPSSAAPVATGSPSSGYMAVVDEWRQKLGMDKVTQDPKLEASSLEGLKRNPGKMEHQKFPDVFGQVLAARGMEEFEHIWVGGWLCEVPSTPGLDGVCATQSEGWDYRDERKVHQTGHNEILVNKQYTKIGCASFQGITGCDFSYDY